MPAAPKVVLQKSSWDCGPTCIEAVTGTKPKIGSLHMGTSALTMVETLRGMRKDVTEGSGWDQEDLKHHTKQGRYVIALIESGGVSHWVVVWKVARGIVMFLDPEVGKRSLKTKDFLKLWSAEGYDCFGIAA